MSNLHVSRHTIQKEVGVPKCLGNLWQGPKKFDVLPALRESNIPVKEFDSHWGEKVKSLRTDEDKRRFIKMLKEGGVGDGKRDVPIIQLAC